jgi:ABC-type glycerol-3-phosphate transport system permease component
VYVPVSLPAIATITLFSVVRHWNSFFDGLIYMNSPQKFPLQTYLQQLVVEISALNLSDPDEIRRRAEISSRTLNSAKIVVAMVPVLVIYPFLQRYFIHGIVLGSVKG